MQRQFHELMLCPDNVVVSGVLSGQAYTFAMNPNTYRLLLIAIGLMICVILSFWLLAVYVVLYVVMAFFTPRYEPMYDSWSKEFDSSNVFY